MRTVLAVVLGLLFLPGAGAQERPPIIDMHLHALAADSQGPPPLAMCTPIDPLPTWDPSRPYEQTFLEMLKNPRCSDPVWSPKTDEEVMTQTFDVLKRRNIIGVVSGPAGRVEAWLKAEPERLIPAVEFQLGKKDALSPDVLRALHAKGRLAVLGEVLNQYGGILPDDPRMEPYWTLAEELDVPVGIHIGPGPPGVAYLGATGYRARMHSPLTLEEVLVNTHACASTSCTRASRCWTTSWPCSMRTPRCTSTWASSPSPSRAPRSIGIFKASWMPVSRAA